MLFLIDGGGYKPGSGWSDAVIMNKLKDTPSNLLKTTIHEFHCIPNVSQPIAKTPQESNAHECHTALSEGQ